MKTIVGGGPGGDFTFKFAGKPPLPKADTTWSTTVSERKSLEAGLQSGPVISRTSYKVTYSYMAHQNRETVRVQLYHPAR